MNIKRLLASLLIFGQISTSLADSTINPNVPATNSALSSAVVRNNFQAAYTDVNNLLSNFAGSTTPVNPTRFQRWVDTTSSPYSLKIYDGNGSWLLQGTIDPTTHTYTGVGGTATSLASATTTVNVGSATAPTIGQILTATSGSAATWQTPGAGSGTVTSVSVTSVNGVSGSVATATTTPAISLTLGAITPTTVNGNTLTTGTGTLTLGASKTLTASNTLTMTGTDGSGIAFGAGGSVAYATNKLSNFAQTTSSELAGVITNETGTGSLVFSDSAVLTTPTFVAPALGTPSSGVGTNLTGTATGLTAGVSNAIKSVSGIVTVATATAPTAGQILTAQSATEANWQTVTGTGSVTSVSVTSANGVSGSVATATTTPAITLTLGAITPTTVNGNTITTGSGILTLGASKTLTVSNSLTMTGTDGSGIAFGAGGTAAYTDKVQTFTGVQSFTSPNVTTSLTTPSTTFALANTTATTLNLGGAATTLNVGASTGTLTVGNTTLAAKAGTFSTTLDVTGHTTFEGVTSTGATGTNKLVYDTSPTLVTPTLGVASVTSINKMAVTAPATSSTIAVADGKTLTASNSITLAGTDATTMTFPPASASVGYLNIPQNSQSAAYTTVLGDSGKHIFHPAADTNARTYTIDSNANVAYAIGTAITFINMTANVVTIAITSDTMYLCGAGTTGSRSLAIYGTATAVKMTTTTWLICGSGLT